MVSQTEIFAIQNDSQFHETALKVFRYQAEKNLVYKQFVRLLEVDPWAINQIKEIPFLPIRFFKSHEVISGSGKPEKVFTSSGTSGVRTSKHFVTDLNFYKESLRHSFFRFYGDFHDYTIFALLPSYLEREGSSLIDMVEFWVNESGSGGFYLYNHEKLYNDLIEHDKSGRKAILIGVSFALLDFAEKFPMQLKNTIIMETGGMKGRREEMTRAELHKKLRNGLGVAQIHSEYGMTELLSQAYSQANSKFLAPSWMKVLIRDTEDPFYFLPNQKTGGINVIDLANLNSCSFIATDDLGKINADGTFEVLGRFDNSDVRGCNLMVAEV